MSNIYISVDPESRDNYLEHGFKYIKRYKVNGKWRYVYADKKQHNAIRGAAHEAARRRRNAKELGEELKGPTPNALFKQDFARWLQKKAKTDDNRYNALVKNYSVGGRLTKTYKLLRNRVTKKKKRR